MRGIPIGLGNKSLNFLKSGIQDNFKKHKTHTEQISLSVGFVFVAMDLVKAHCPPRYFRIAA